MKRIFLYFAVILLSMSLASCPDEGYFLGLGIDNQSEKEIEVGVLFNSEYRKQWIKDEFGEDVPSLYSQIWQISPKSKFYDAHVEYVGCEDWKCFFAKEGIDTLTIVIAREESAISQWIESHADSLLLCRRDFTLDALGASNNHLDIVIDDSLHVTMKPSIYPHPW